MNDILPSLNLSDTNLDITHNDKKYHRALLELNKYDIVKCYKKIHIIPLFNDNNGYIGINKSFDEDIITNFRCYNPNHSNLISIQCISSNYENNCIYKSKNICDNIIKLNLFFKDNFLFETIIIYDVYIKKKVNI